MVVFAPGEDRLAGEAAVSAQDDASFREALADEGNDPFQRFNRPVAGVAVARAQLRPYRPRADEAIEGQIAVVVVVTVEELPLLGAVDEAVGGVEIEHDLASVLRET